MRRTREAKPPRRPRVLTWRLVLVSLVVGIVLAAGSVVVATLAPQMRARYERPPDRAVHFEAEGHVVLVGRSDGRMATLWEVKSMPREHDAWHRHLVVFWGAESLDEPWWPIGGRPALDGYYRDRIAYHAGWPMRCAYRYGSVGSHGMLIDESPVPTIRIGRRQWSFPVLPLWPGLLGNTLFYAILVLVPLVLLRRRTLRRRARRRLCVACGYELGEGVSACPECGLARAGTA
jgi:hypothetical protein